MRRIHTTRRVSVSIILHELREPDAMSSVVNPERHVAVVGGGITGLAVAHYLQEAALQQSLRIGYSLIESTDRLGGKLVTEEVEGYGDRSFVVEGGPDSFITQKPWALGLARELGLQDRLVGTNDSQRKVFVLNRGRPTPLPDGVLLIVPTKFMPFALSPLISPIGKLRMGMDLFIAPKRDDEDETLADFISRRLGTEALDKIAEPLMSGIYNAEAERQSLMATFPRFRVLEQMHGSLIKGMLASRKMRNKPGSPGSSVPQNGRPTSIFMSLQDGIYELAAALAGRLTGDVMLGSGVRSIRRRPDDRYALELSGMLHGVEIVADSVILTTPSYVAADLLGELAPGAAELLRQIRYVSTGTISFGFRTQDLRGASDGFGVVIPRSEHRPVNAVTFSSTKFDHRAPEGFSLLRVFFGGSRSPETMDLDDDELVRVVRQQLLDILGVDAEPVFHRIYRWPRANPQYDIGHLDLVDSIDAALPKGLYVTGSPYRGVGIPDCVHQARIIAEKIISEFREETEVEEAI